MYSIRTLEHITIEPTSFCNARCPQCDRFDSKNNTIVPLKHLDVNILKKNMQPNLFPNLKQVDISGNCGDILNHKDPNSFLLLYKDIQYIRMETNGSIRDESFYKNLAKFKNLELTFSIDGLKDTNHLYRQECDFDKIMSNVKSYINAGGNAVWKFIVFKHNEHQINEAKEQSQKIGFKNFKIQHSDRSWYYGKKWAVYNKNKYQFDLEPSSILENNLHSDNRNLNKKVLNIYKKNKVIEGCPWAQQKKVFVSYNGYVVPCCMLSTDLWNNTYNTKFFKKYVKNLDTISLYKNDIKKIFESEFYTKDLPNSFKKNPMPTCLQHCSK